MEAAGEQPGEGREPWASWQQGTKEGLILSKGVGALGVERGREVPQQAHRKWAFP